METFWCSYSFSTSKICLYSTRSFSSVGNFYFIVYGMLGFIFACILTRTRKTQNSSPLRKFISIQQLLFEESAVYSHIFLSCIYSATTSTGASLQLSANQKPLLYLKKIGCADLIGNCPIFRLVSFDPKGFRRLGWCLRNT